MKVSRGFVIALGVALLTGGLAGYYAGGYVGGRIGEHEDAALPSQNTTLFRAPASGEAGGSALRHPGEELGAWMDKAWDIFSRRGSPGFNAATDAPQVLLALERLTAADFALLMKQLDTRSETPAKRLLQDFLFAEWSRRDSQAALAWTREHRPDKFQEGVVALSASNARAAWTAWKSRPGAADLAGSGEPAMSIFDNWARQDRAAALEAVLDPGLKNHMGAVMGFYGSALPDRAQFPREWEESRDGIAKRILELPSPERATALSSFLMSIHNNTASVQRDELALWVKQQTLTKSEQAVLLTGIAQWDGSSDSAASWKAFPWLWQQVPLSERGGTLKSIVEYWASEKPWSSKDTDGCGKWLNEQTDLGPECAPALKAFALHAAAKDPEAGLAWAQKVTDLPLRAEALREVSALILKQWPHRAAELGVASLPPSP